MKVFTLRSVTSIQVNVEHRAIIVCGVDVFGGERPGGGSKAYLKEHPVYPEDIFLCVNRQKTNKKAAGACM